MPVTGLKAIDKGAEPVPAELLIESYLRTQSMNHHFMKRTSFFLKTLLASFILSSVPFCTSLCQQTKGSGNAGLDPAIGIKGGLNLANLYVDDVQDENMKVGFNLGLFAKLPVARGLSIQPEVLYSVKGSTLNFGILNNNEYRFNLNYVEVPLLAVVNVTSNFNIHAGGYTAYLAQANIKKETDGPDDQIADFDEDDFNRLDYGLVGGLGIDVANVAIGARYNYGLKEISKSGSFSNLVLGNGKNSAISIYIGFAF